MQDIKLKTLKHKKGETVTFSCRYCAQPWREKELEAAPGSLRRRGASVASVQEGKEAKKEKMRAPL